MSLCAYTSALQPANILFTSSVLLSVIVLRDIAGIVLSASLVILLRRASASNLLESLGFALSAITAFCYLRSVSMLVSGLTLHKARHHCVLTVRLLLMTAINSRHVTPTLAPFSAQALSWMCLFVIRPTLFLTTWIFLPDWVTKPCAKQNISILQAPKLFHLFFGLN